MQNISEMEGEAKIQNNKVLILNQKDEEEDKFQEI